MMNLSQLLFVVFCPPLNGISRKRRYSESILTGQHFASTRDTLKSKQEELKRKGKGNKPREASCLTQKEIDTLYEKGAMGLNSPQALVNSIWFNNCTVCISLFAVAKNNAI